jgi:hypothetical protein
MRGAVSWRLGVPALFLLAALLAGTPALAQEQEQSFDDLFEGQILEEQGGPEQAPADQGTDEEGLFEGDIIEGQEQPEGEPSPEEASPEEAFLVSESWEWGGSFDLSFDTRVSWNGYPNSWNMLFNEGDSSLMPRLAADLFFDARPERDFRVFGKVKAAYEYQFDTGSYDWDAGIFELFADFQYKDLLFFRAGKQTVQWGVGYFFSPADVLSLVSIDLEDPEAEREGPLAVKVQAPFAAHNAYLYLVANDVEKPSEVAVAPKLELVMGTYELGIGGFYQADLAPKGMLTLTGPLWELQLFSEAVLQWGSDITYVRPDPPPYQTYTRDGLLFSGTAGAAYINPDWDLTVVAQYLFNGPGYEGAFPAAAFGAAVLAGELTPADYPVYSGKHYVALGVNWFELLDSRFSVVVLYLANLSDRSGLIIPTVTWGPIDQLSLSTGLRLYHGQAGDEYGPGALAYTFEVSIGGEF